MRFHIRLLTMLLVLIVLLAACGAPAPTPVPTATNTIEPTATLAPTATPNPTATALPPTATPFVVKGPQAIEFDLGEVSIIQPQYSPDSKFYTMPLRLNGLIAMPEGAGPFPIVVLIHGRHGSCPVVEGQDTLVQQWPCENEQPNYKGFDYLASALAAHGYLAMSINVNAAYTNGWGEDTSGNVRFPQIIDLYLASLAAANADQDVGFGVPLAGKVDLSKIAFVVHSQSGELTTSVIADRSVNTSTESIAQGFGPISNILYLAPVYGAEAAAVPDVPLSVILPACDNDVSDLAGQKYYEAARTTPERQSFAAAVYLQGANHNFFNSILPDEAESSTRAGCEAKNRLSADEQRAFLAQYAPDFMDAAFGVKPYPEVAGLDPFLAAPDRLYGYRVLTSLALPTAQRRIVLLPTETNRFQNNFGGANTIGGPLNVAYCETNQSCLTWDVQPGQPDQLRLSWTGPDAVFSTTLPYAAQDLSHFEMLHLRALVDPTAFLNAPQLPQSFSVIVQDADGDISKVKVPAKTPALTYRPGAPDTKIYGWSGLAPMSSIRIPLSAFDGVDLSRVNTIALALDGQPTGSILMADLEFLSKEAVPLQAQTSVTGTVSAATPVTLTGSMRLEVTLQDTSLQDVPAVTIGQVTLTGEGQALPVPYAIEYDPATILLTHTYTVRAQIFDADQLKYTSTTAYPVITRDNPTGDVNVVVEPVGGISRATPAQPTGVITGTVTYLERIALPADAQIEVILVDASATDLAAQLGSQQSISAKGKQVPIAYRLEYPSDQIDPTHTYTVQARITLGNQPLFDTPQPIAVLTQDAPLTGVEIVVQPVQ
jgi:uncharacterized lipoprotein YbaY